MRPSADGVEHAVSWPLLQLLIQHVLCSSLIFRAEVMFKFSLDTEARSGRVLTRSLHSTTCGLWSYEKYKVKFDLKKFTPVVNKQMGGSVWQRESARKTCDEACVCHGHGSMLKVGTGKGAKSCFRF